jgi:hypothetical protein
MQGLQLATQPDASVDGAAVVDVLEEPESSLFSLAALQQPGASTSAAPRVKVVMVRMLRSSLDATKHRGRLTRMAAPLT